MNMHIDRNCGSAKSVHQYTIGGLSPDPRQLEQLIGVAGYRTAILLTDNLCNLNYSTRLDFVKGDRFDEFRDTAFRSS